MIAQTIRFLHQYVCNTSSHTLKTEQLECGQYNIENQYEINNQKIGMDRTDSDTIIRNKHYIVPS